MLFGRNLLMQPSMVPFDAAQGLNPPSLTHPQAYLSWRGTVLRAGRSGDWEAARAELAAAQVEQAAAVEASLEVEVPQQQEPEGPSQTPSAGTQEAAAPAGKSAGSRGVQTQPALDMLPPASISHQAPSELSALPAGAAGPEEAAATGGRAPVTAAASPLPSPTSPVPSPPDALQQGQLARDGAGAGSKPRGAAQPADAGHAAAPEVSPGPRRHLNLGSPRQSEELQHDRRSQTIDYAVSLSACTWEALLLPLRWYTTGYLRSAGAATNGAKPQQAPTGRQLCSTTCDDAGRLVAGFAHQAWALTRACGAQTACRLYRRRGGCNMGQFCDPSHVRAQATWQHWLFPCCFPVFLSAAL